MLRKVQVCVTNTVDHTHSIVDAAYAYVTVHQELTTTEPHSLPYSGTRAYHVLNTLHVILHMPLQRRVTRQQRSVQRSSSWTGHATANAA
jgi:DNA polymerase III epsilon subunit-like protein